MIFQPRIALFLEPTRRLLYSELYKKMYLGFKFVNILGIFDSDVINKFFDFLDFLTVDFHVIFDNFLTFFILVLQSVNSIFLRYDGGEFNRRSQDIWWSWFDFWIKNIVWILQYFALIFWSESIDWWTDIPLNRVLWLLKFVT